MKRPSFSSCRLLPLAVLFVGLLTACGSSKLLTAPANYCEPPTYAIVLDAPIRVDRDSLAADSLALAGHMSMQNIVLARALGIEKELKALPALREDTTLDGRLRREQYSRRIQAKIAYAEAAIDGVSAELDCEGERLDQLASVMDNTNSKKTNRLTVASIVIGAASAVAGAFITNDGWNKGVAVGAGLAGAGLGFATLGPKGVRVKLDHQRNLIRAFWQEKNYGEFPAIVWFMLTDRHFTNSGQSSLMRNACARWLTYQFDGDRQEAEQSVILSNGGIYHADELHERATMVNQMQAIVRSLYQNMSSLVWEVNRLEGN